MTDKLRYALTLVMSYPGVRKYLGRQIVDVADAALAEPQASLIVEGFNEQWVGADPAGDPVRVFGEPGPVAQAEHQPVASGEAPSLREAMSLIGAAVGALEYHQEQTRPIHRTQQIIAILRKAIDAHPPVAPPQPQPAEVPEMTEERIELVAAWNDLPEELRCHPDLNRLYRAAQKA